MATRWEQAGSPRGYGQRFAELVAAGTDIDGEARFADALAPREATVLDAGSGMGRVGAALQRRGHRVTGVDLDRDLIDQSRATYPELSVVQGRLEQLSAPWLAQHGRPRSYELIVCVGNVMVFLAPGSEREVLRRFAALLAPGGRILVGFETASAKPEARTYPEPEFARDAAAAGLRVESRFAGFALEPFTPERDFLVAVLTAARG